MSNLADIIRYQKSQGKGVLGAAAGGIKERLKEKFDPRKMFNQKGLMTALFPALKAYKAKTKDDILSGKKDLLSTSTDANSILPVLQDISFNTKTTAKNLSVLPIISREFNVIRQNFVKLVKGRLIKPATKADAFFQKSKEREQLYENQLLKERLSANKSPTKIDESKNGLSTLLLSIIPVALIGALIYQIKKMEDNDIFDGIMDVYQNMKDAYETIQINIEQEKIYKELNDIKYEELTGLQKNALLRQDEIIGKSHLGDELNGTNNPGGLIDKSKEDLQLKRYKTMEEGRAAQDEYWKQQSEKGLGEAARKNYGTDKNATMEEKRKSLEETKAILESTKTGSAKEMRPQQDVSTSRKTPKVYSSVELGELDATKKFPNAKDINAYGKMESVDNILLHHTGGTTASGAITEMTRTKSDGVQYATQFVIDKGGNVYRIRNDTDIVNHVGATNKGFEHVKNSNTVGIEIVGRNSSDFSPEQMQATKDLVKKLQMKYGVSSDRIYGHGEVAGGRKMHSEGTELAKSLRREIKLEASPRKPGDQVSSVQDLGRVLDLNSTEVALLEDFMNRKQVTYIFQQTNVQNNNTAVMAQNKSKSNFAGMISKVA